MKITLADLNSRDLVGRLGAVWQKTRLQSNIAAEMDVYRVWPLQMPILQNLGYIISKWNIRNLQVTSYNIVLGPVMNLAELLKVQFCQIAAGSIKTRTFVPRSENVIYKHVNRSSINLKCTSTTYSNTLMDENTGLNYSSTSALTEDQGYCFEWCPWILFWY